MLCACDYTIRVLNDALQFEHAIRFRIMSQFLTNSSMDLLAFFLIGKLLQSDEDNSNIVISPLSVYQTLAMSALGAKGKLTSSYHK